MSTSPSSSTAAQAESKEIDAGAYPSRNTPPKPADRESRRCGSHYNVENLYDQGTTRSTGATSPATPGRPGVDPLSDYVPASEDEYRQHLSTLADQIIKDLQGPTSWCRRPRTRTSASCPGPHWRAVTRTTPTAHPTAPRAGAWASALPAASAYTAYDRLARTTGASPQYLYRTDRCRWCRAAERPVIGSAPTGSSTTPRGLPANADVQNPKVLNADLPADVDTSRGGDGSTSSPRLPRWAFNVAAAPG